MDASKKKLRNLNKLAELLGMEIAPEEIVKVATAQTPEQIAIEVSREAEAVLLYGVDRRKFIQKECDNCGAVFAVNRSSVSCCSDHCRSIKLGKLGIIWDWSRNPESRWDFREPLVVSPSVLERLNTHLETYPAIAQEQVVEELPEQVAPEIEFDEPIQSSSGFDDFLESLSDV